MRLGQTPHAGELNMQKVCQFHLKGWKRRKGKEKTEQEPHVIVYNKEAKYRQTIIPASTTDQFCVKRLKKKKRGKKR